MMIFWTRSIWLELEISQMYRKTAIETVFGGKREIRDRDQAIICLQNALEISSNNLLNRIQNTNSYLVLLDLLGILNEVMHRYLSEKKSRLKMVEEGIREESLIESTSTNRNIERNIIDACNIWIENSILYQHDLTFPQIDPNKDRNIDKELLFELYIYGCASQGLTLLRLSKDLIEGYFYGVAIDPEADIPLNILKDHPVIYYNYAISGNQAVLGDKSKSINPKEMAVAKGFESEYGISFSIFFGVLKYFKETMLNNNHSMTIVLNRKDFVDEINRLNPPINPELLLECASLDKNKVQMQMKDNEQLVWKVGTNKYRLEIRPIIELDNDTIVINAAACTQATQLWYSFLMNGGNCYSIKGKRDNLQQAMEKRNKELSDILVEKIRDVLRANYNPTVDLPNVQYSRIFGSREKDYGDYDIVFYSDETSELYLVEAKYFSDSLYASALTTDYEKIFADNGYYDHCRARYDLVMHNPSLMKQFLGINPDKSIKSHFLFISSKPIEMELQDKDKVVTFLPLCIFDDFIKGKLSEDGKETIRPEVIL